jgi:protein gp37
VAVRFLSVEPLLEDLGILNLRNIHWMIVGGESGAGAQPMQSEWVRSLERQCRQFEVPFFFKQWAECVRVKPVDPSMGSPMMNCKF